MMRWLVAGLALVACGPVAPQAGAPAMGGRVAPERVILYRDVVTVEMSDRAFCTGPRGRTSGAWSGHLAGCAHQWAYRADPGGTRAPRIVLSAGSGRAANVTLTAPDGTDYPFTGPR